MPIMSTEEIKIKNARDRIERQFWIDPQGKIYKFTGQFEEALEIVSLHYWIALEIFPDAEYPQDSLIKLGWIPRGLTVAKDYTKEPTQAQINTIDKLREEYQKGW